MKLVEPLHLLLACVRRVALLSGSSLAPDSLAVTTLDQELMDPQDDNNPGHVSLFSQVLHPQNVSCFAFSAYQNRQQLAKHALYEEQSHAVHIGHCGGDLNLFWVKMSFIMETFSRFVHVLAGQDVKVKLECLDCRCSRNFLCQ